MPKFKFVVACEKTIIDTNGPVSLISMFQRMNIKLQQAPLPEKAIAPSLWSVFTLWENDPKEVGQQFTQVLRIYTPDGALWQEHEIPFKNDNVDDYQTKINLQMVGMPIWIEGFMDIRVWLKGNDAEVGSYRFTIAYLPKEENAKTES